MMKMMKKCFAVVLSLALVLSLAACGSKAAPEPSPEASPAAAAVASPEVSAAASSEAANEATAEVSPAATPEATAEAVPEETAGVSSAADSEASPAAASAGSPEVQIDYGTSAVYSREDMEAAIDLIIKEFGTWEGCELHSISYSSDDECNTSDNIDWMNNLEEANDSQEAFTQCIMFTSAFHSPREGGGAWNPDQEYTGWQWWLARPDGGEWKLMTWGY